jgi:hypothetical protein
MHCLSFSALDFDPESVKIHKNKVIQHTKKLLKGRYKSFKCPASSHTKTTLFPLND